MTQRDRFLERELAEARQREDEYRARLARHRELARKLRLHADSLRQALRGAGDGPLNVKALLQNVALLSSQALGLPRTSIWLFDEERENLVCHIQMPEGPHGAPPVSLPIASIPAYIKAITQTDANALAVEDTLTDPRTIDLHDYMKENDVGALIDIPLLGPGTIYGVVCHEHQGGPRHWHESEVEFANDVGAMVALAFEADRRTRAEQKARSAEAKYRSLVENLPVAVYSFVARTKQLEYVSPRVRDLSGLPAELYLAAGGIDRWIASIDPDHRAQVLERFSMAEGESPEGEIVYRITHGDGSRRWIRDTCAAVRDARGRAFAIQGTLADITEHKLAQGRQAEVERRYRTLLENVDLLALTISPSSRIEFANECFLRASGFTAQEVLGQDVFDLLVPEPERTRLRGEYGAALKKGAMLRRLETSIRTRKGDLRRVLWTNTLLKDAEGDIVGACCLGVDITLRIEEETKQVEAQKLESLGRLAASVAHDFNNLLTVIMNETSLIDSETGANERARRQIQGAVQHAHELTRSLLAYARRETISPALVAVDALLCDLQPMLAALVGRQLTFSMHLDAADAQVVVDPTQLRQLVVNLVSNAADATRGHGSTVRLVTRLVWLEADQARAKGLWSEGHFVLIDVADDGPGMAPDVLEKVFDPFFTTKAAGKGTGLGLAMCHSIVRRAAGSVSATSTLQEGSVFSVHLPVARLRREGPAAVQPAPAAHVAATAPVVLVVEDNEAVRNLVTRMLAEEGLMVREAASVAAAEAELRERKIDLLLSDGRLPDGDGNVFAARVAAERPEAKIILMSGGPLGLAAAGAAAVIQKPFRIDALVKTVLAVLGQQGRS